MEWSCRLFFCRCWKWRYVSTPLTFLLLSILVHLPFLFCFKKAVARLQPFELIIKFIFGLNSDLQNSFSRWSWCNQLSYKTPYLEHNPNPQNWIQIKNVLYKIHLWLSNPQRYVLLSPWLEFQEKWMVHLLYSQNEALENDSLLKLILWLILGLKISLIFLT